MGGRVAERVGGRVGGWVAGWVGQEVVMQEVATCNGRASC